MIINIPNKAEQRNNRHVRVAFVQHFIRVIRNQYAGLKPQSGEISYVHSYYRGIHIDRPYDLSAMLIKIPERILCHFTASILNNLNLLHNKTSCSE